MGVIARYRKHLPVGPATPDVDLGEGSTPLVPSQNIGRALGLRHLYFKYEGLNPTGSLKDRGMVVAVGQASGGGRWASRIRRRRQTPAACSHGRCRRARPALGTRSPRDSGPTTLAPRPSG